VYGEYVRHRLLEIVVDAPAEPYRVDDGTEVVVEQDDRRGLACHVVPTSAHGDADVRGLESRASLTPSPVIATTCPSALSAFTMSSFCAGVMRANTLTVRARVISSRSSMRSSSLPVSTAPSSMPARRAIARAVSG
jgi:hypothetical protein